MQNKRFRESCQYKHNSMFCCHLCFNSRCCSFIFLIEVHSDGRLFGWMFSGSSGIDNCRLTIFGGWKNSVSLNSHVESDDFSFMTIIAQSVRTSPSCKHAQLVLMSIVKKKELTNQPFVFWTSLAKSNENIRTLVSRGLIYILKYKDEVIVFFL